MSASRLTMATLVILSCLCASAWGQHSLPMGPGGPGGYGPPPGMLGPMGPGMGGPMAGPMGPMPPGRFDPRVAPAAYMQGEGGEAPGGEGCAGGECDSWDAGMRNILFPEDDAYPRWYNLDFEFVLFKRDKKAPNIVFSRRAGTNAVALQLDDLVFHEEPGFRLNWQTIVGPGESVEVGYLGTLFYDEIRDATGNANLNTVFSNFNAAPFAGSAAFDLANSHRITLESDLHSAELLYRKRWISPTNRIHNSLELGVRFVRLDEKLDFQGASGGGTFDYRVRTENNLLGFQTGGDLFVRVLPFLMLGGELKAGIYGNNALQHTRIAATTIATINDDLDHTTVAFLGEARVMAVARLSSHWSFKSGYQLMYLDRLALASENFNPAAPIAGRVPVINFDGEAFYHGLFAGAEWTW